jgi:hypothetical protein
VASEDEVCESLLGLNVHEILLSAEGVLLLYGDGGSTKTTLSVDLAVHAAAGLAWLGLFTIPRPLTVVLLENEGSRATFRLKLRGKAATWTGPPFIERVYVYTDPWPEFSFADESLSAGLAQFLAERNVDLLIAGPLVELGARGAGTPDDVTEFGRHLNHFRAQVGRPLAIVLLHHENKGRDVSGAWSRFPDSLVRVTSEEHGRTDLHFRKTRHSSRTHGAKLTLRWLVDEEGFEVVNSDFRDRAAEQAVRDADALAWLVNYVSELPGLARGRVEQAFQDRHGGHGRNVARRVIDRQLQLAASPPPPDENGEKILLVAGPGARPHGTYLYVFDSFSPPATQLFGENGDNRQPLVSRHSPPPIGIGGEAARSGERSSGETEWNRP